jgi:DNA-binding response OmpR family regulator
MRGAFRQNRASFQAIKAQRGSQVEVAHDPVASSGKILVVDDDRLVLATLAHGLSEAGYEVIDADNGDDAILLARKHRPDLALLDIRMEGMSGFDVAAYLREHSKMPFMFLSAFTDSDTVRQVHELGAVDYLVKPLDIGHIVPAVRAVFDRIRASSAGAPIEPVPPVATALSLSPLSAMAVGVLMHRFSLPRQAAVDRLKRMAVSAARSMDDEAERLLEAVERLAAPSGG